MANIANINIIGIIIFFGCVFDNRIKSSNQSHVRHGIFQLNNNIEITITIAIPLASSGL